MALRGSCKYWHYQSRAVQDQQTLHRSGRFRRTGQDSQRDESYRSRNKMVAVCQTTFSNSFSWMKNVLFWFKFHWNLFPKIELLKSLCWINYWPGVENVPSRFGAENPYEYHHLDLKLVCPKRPVDLIVQSHWNFARNSTASLLDNWKTRIRNSDL